MDKGRFNRLQLRMLVMTMIGYTPFYFPRKNFSFGWSVPFACIISIAIAGAVLFACLWNTRANSCEK